MATFVLHHRHGPAECAVAFAAWKGFDSPLRHSSAFASCYHGGHEVWWTVDAAGHEAALALLPPYVAERTVVIGVRPVPIP